MPKNKMGSVESSKETADAQAVFTEEEFSVTRAMGSILIRGLAHTSLQIHHINDAVRSPASAGKFQVPSFRRRVAGSDIVNDVDQSIDCDEDVDAVEEVAARAACCIAE